MNEMISVVVPVYNVENYLERCVESIIKQSYTNFEIILVDDGSADSSGVICDQYRLLDDRIKVIHKDNGGLSDARNVGIDNSKGDYLCFVDSDDFLNSDYLKILYNMCVHNDCDIAICNIEKVYSDGVNGHQEAQSVEFYTGIEMIKNLYNCTNEYNVLSVIACNKLYKREVVQDIRFPKGLIHEDDATTYKFFYNAKRVGITSNRLYYYYQRDNSITGSGFSLKRLDYLKAIMSRREFYKEKNLMEYYQLDCKLYLIWSLYFYKMVFYYYRNEKDILKNIKNGYQKMYRETNIKKMGLKDKVKFGIGFYFPQVFAYIYILKRTLKK